MFDSLVAELEFELYRHNLRVTVAHARKEQMNELQEDRDQFYCPEVEELGMRAVEPDWYCPECCDWYPKGDICLCRQESLV